MKFFPFNKSQVSPPPTSSKVSFHPVGFQNTHFLEQIERRAAYRTSIIENKPEFQPESLIPLYYTFSITNILSIEPVTERFTIKYRCYAVWEMDIEENSELFQFSSKAIEKGHYYPLSRSEADFFLSNYPVPTVNIFNQIHTEPIDSIDIRVYGGEKGKTAIMMNQAFTVTCRQKFQLHNFPFDLQYLTFDLKFTNTVIWKKFLFQLNTVQLHREAIDQIEWDIGIPSIQEALPKHSGIVIKLPIIRKSNYYVQNMIVIIIILTSLGLTSFAFRIVDLSGRTSIVLTLILTSVAFKFSVSDSAMPKVSYATMMDKYITLNLLLLALMTVFTILPQLYSMNADYAKYASVNPESNGDVDDDWHSTPNFINGIFAVISVGLIIIGFGWLIYVSYKIVSKHHQENPPIPIHLYPINDWFSFHFMNSKFLLPINQEIHLEDHLFQRNNVRHRLTIHV